MISAQLHETPAPHRIVLAFNILTYKSDLAHRKHSSRTTMETTEKSRALHPADASISLCSHRISAIQALPTEIIQQITDDLVGEDVNL
jgi:hypothetical protein